jgi:site-specific DNA-cytosine methylase
LKQLTHGSLFAGIGGFDLGFERAGIKTVWQAEIDPFCRKVLERHFPDARRYHNIKRVKRFAEVNVISGGFPCQDVSLAGRRAGVAGERSGLYREMVRAICLVRPGYAVMENVAALVTNGLGRVLGDMAEMRYDAEWDCISASDLGAPHGRDRIWITFADADEFKRKNGRTTGARWWEWSACQIEEARDANGAWQLQPPRIIGDIRRRDDDSTDSGTRWQADWKDQFEAFRRMDDGIPAGLDDAAAVRSLGNSLLPQIAEWIGRRIIEGEERLTG